MAAATTTLTAFVSAAAKETLTSKECTKALAACGYAPEDFGSYSHVLEACGNARDRTGGARTQGRERLAPGEKKTGSARDQHLAECQSGHLSENGRHQTDRKRNKGSYCPLYDGHEAPCMPHAGQAGHANTAHGGVTNADIQSSNKANAKPRRDGTMGIDRERAATRAATEAALDFGMKKTDQPAAEQMRAERFAAIRELNAQQGEDGVKPKDGKKLSDKEIEENYANERKTALKCIEAFFNAQWKEMARNTQAKKAAAAKKAKENADAARAEEKKVAKQPPSDAQKARLAEARKAREAAEDEETTANAENDKVKDLNPEDVDRCMGQSRPQRDRNPMTKSDPTDPPNRKTKKDF